MQSKSDETSLDETFNEKFNINDTPKSDSEKREYGDFEADEDPSMDTKKGKQIHRFYFPKFPIFKDPELELKIIEAEKLVGERNETRLEIESKINLKADDLTEITFNLRPLMSEEKLYRSFLQENYWRKNASLQKLAELHRQRTKKNGNKKGGVYLCSSEEELNDLILSLRYRLRCQSDGAESFGDEKLMLREIKQLEGTRSKVQASAARREKILALEGQNGFVQYELLEEQQCNVKEKKHKLARKIKLMKEQHKAIERDLKLLKKELAFADRKRDEAYEGLAELRRQGDERVMNSFCLHAIKCIKSSEIIEFDPCSRTLLVWIEAFMLLISLDALEW
ncbi:hypothetical protein Sjap_025725 [Stephania japonica]|uniref:Uncharacterized protein n=1 Tax=Stephania japonica TaxID=461633 RepID=A0AAP0EA27_9MAGN